MGNALAREMTPLVAKRMSLPPARLAFVSAVRSEPHRICRVVDHEGLHFERTNIHRAVDDAGKPALIGDFTRGQQRIISGVDRWAAWHEANGLSGPAVVFQRREQGVHVEQIGGLRQAAATGIIADQVVPRVVRDGSVIVRAHVQGRVVGNDRVGERQRARDVIVYATAVVLRRVIGDGAVDQRQCAIVINTAAFLRRCSP